MTSEENRSEGQVSEATHLRGRMGEQEIQQDEGAPPAEDVDEAIDRAVGRDQA